MTAAELRRIVESDTTDARVVDLLRATCHVCKGGGGFAARPQPFGPPVPARLCVACEGEGTLPMGECDGGES